MTEPLSTIPLALAYEALALVAGEFGPDASAVADTILYSRVSHWWGQNHREWGHPQASMLAAEAGYLIEGKPSRLNEIRPDDDERAEYLRQAAVVRADWEAHDCPGLLDNLEPTLAWVRKAIQKRDAA